MRGIGFAFLMVLTVLALSGQNGKPTPVSVISDWTAQHVILPESNSFATMIQVRRDPRYWFQFLNRRLVGLSRGPAHDHHDGQASQRDWSVSLGGAATGPQNTYPAKYSFDVTAAPSCTADFVVTGINLAGGAGQANIVGLNKLYTNATGTGYCTGTGPAFMFAYNVGPGAVYASVAMSLDGKKLAFIENNGTSTYFHVLTYGTTGSNGSRATSPAVPGTGNNGLDMKVLLGETSTTAPFVDYLNDVAYVTTTTHVRKITGVFKGTPAAVTGGGWPVTMSGATGLSTPVFDQITKHVFYKDFNGTVYYIDDSMSPAVLSSSIFAVTSGTDGSSRPVIVDSTNGKIYAASNGATGTNSVIGQADTSLGSQVRVNVGSADSAGRSSFAPDFNNAYYAGTLGSAYLYAVGNDRTTSLRPALYRIGFVPNSNWVLSSTTHDGPVALTTTGSGTTGISSSPLTEFYNVTLARDFLFVGITNHCSTGVTGGCIRSIDITGSTMPASVNAVIAAAAGGTSGITVDNYSSAGEASSVYYVTLGTGAGTYALVKSTQSLLQ
jgi:hypothetical protein